MEQVRNVRLDHVCEGLAEERRTMNAAKQEEAAYIESALKVMQQHGVSVYKHAGIELARVPGAEKLRVRLTKDEGDADVEAGEVSSSQADLVEAPPEADEPVEGEAYH